MKKRIITLLLIGLMGVQLTACSEPTCKADDCEETEIYEDGYCRYHYYLKSGEDILKGIVN